MEEGRAADPAGHRRPLGGPLAAEHGAAPDPGDLGRRTTACSPTCPARSGRPTRSCKVRQVVIPKCGHAPQIEKARLVNQLDLAVPAGQAQDRSPRRSIPSGSSKPARSGPDPSARPASWPVHRSKLDRRTRMNDFTLFLGKFLTQPGAIAIASVAPSSRWLSRTTVRNIDWDRAEALVELGAGTGPITRVIAEQARPDCRVVVVERDPDFAGCSASGSDRAQFRDRRGRRPRPGLDPRRPRDRPSTTSISGLPVPSFPGSSSTRSSGVVRTDPPPRGDLQSDHRDSLGLLAVLPQVLRGRPVRLRAPQPAPGGGVFLPGRRRRSPDRRWDVTMTSRHRLSRRPAGPAPGQPADSTWTRGYGPTALGRIADPVADPGPDPPPPDPPGPPTPGSAATIGFDRIRLGRRLPAGRPDPDLRGALDGLSPRSLPGLRGPDLAGPHPLSWR